MVAIARQSLLRATGLASCTRANASAISPAKRIMAVQQFRLASSAATAPIPGTASMSPAENIALLNEQRLKRPNSPHLSIYQPQVNFGCLYWGERDRGIGQDRFNGSGSAGSIGGTVVKCCKYWVCGHPHQNIGRLGAVQAVDRARTRIENAQMRR